MNIDNRRLTEVQRELIFYRKRLSEAETIEDSLQIMEHINELETEQKTILERCNAL